MMTEDDGDNCPIYIYIHIRFTSNRFIIPLMRGKSETRFGDSIFTNEIRGIENIQMRSNVITSQETLLKKGGEKRFANENRRKI